MYLKKRGHRRYNICPWMKNGKREICGKSCRYDYCKDHRTKIRNGRQPSLPCLNCGIGIRSQIQLCRGCGRERERQRLLKQAKIEKQLEKGVLVMVEPKPWTPTEKRDRDESPSWASAKPENHCMRNDEFCFGLRD